jgi:hypothetical protein
MLYCTLGGSLMRRYQGKQLQDYITGGGTTYKWTRALWISLLSLVLTLLAVFIVAVAVGVIADLKK